MDMYIYLLTSMFLNIYIYIYIYIYICMYVCMHKSLNENKICIFRSSCKISQIFSLYKSKIKMSSISLMHVNLRTSFYRPAKFPPFLSLYFLSLESSKKKNPCLSTALISIDTILDILCQGRLSIDPFSTIPLSTIQQPISNNGNSFFISL